MASHQEFPRRKPPVRGRRPREAERPTATEPTAGAASREAFDVAGYVSDMTAQLEVMAQSANLDLLAYFLGMARSEADLFMRTNSGPSGESEPADVVAGDLPDENQTEFDSPDD